MAENLSFGEKLARVPQGIKDYVLELQTEMKRVTWPSRKQVEATTVVVIFTVFAFAAYFAVVDSVFARLIAKLFSAFTRTPQS
jgi:preprotein translocase subunit SecE